MATAVGAQGTDAAAYDSLSLWQKGARVYRGRGAELVVRARVFGSKKLADYPAIRVAGDSVRWNAATYDRLRTRGVAAVFIGDIVGLAGLTCASFHGGRDVGLQVGSGVVIVVANWLSIDDAHKAQHALSRAIWWHNRDLRHR